LKFKVDENLPAEYAEMLRTTGHEADTVADQKLTGADDAALFKRCQAEDRILLTLDLDFGEVSTENVSLRDSERGRAFFLSLFQVTKRNGS
jgi:predicted nuclease of predicted toxin-antitoxin system